MALVAVGGGEFGIGFAELANDAFFFAKCLDEDGDHAVEVAGEFGDGAVAAGIGAGFQVSTGDEFHGAGEGPERPGEHEVYGDDVGEGQQENDDDAEESFVEQAFLVGL